jgi:hypothetical protein
VKDLGGFGRLSHRLKGSKVFNPAFFSEKNVFSVLIRSFKLIEDQASMYLSIAWGFNPRLLNYIGNLSFCKLSNNISREPLVF